jgi:hypothetical protein
MAGGQGDQIGRIFASWAIICFRAVFKIIVVAQIFGFFFHDKAALILAKIGFATFWAIFSQTV